MTLTRAVMISLALSLGGCACETVKSSDIKTSGLYAQLEADAPGDGKVNVKATLTLGAGSLTYLELAETDVLSATVGTTARAMSRQSLFGATWYQASFDGDAADTQLKVLFARHADTSAPDSHVTLPAPFAFTAPAARQAFPRTAGLTVTWSGSGQADPLRLSARGSCIQSIDTDLNDTGTHPLVAFQPQSGSETKTCDVSLTLVRTRTGAVDPAYGKGGKFEATVTRSLTISSTP
jgi:hypothetical protein